jgi:hypothetical protein
MKFKQKRDEVTTYSTYNTLGSIIYIFAEYFFQLRNYYMSKVVQEVTLLIYILEVLFSSLGRDADYLSSL